MTTASTPLFLSIMGFVAAWIAGPSHMHWWRFLAWNAAGRLVWATLVSVIAYCLGDAAASAPGRQIERRVVENSD
jgi:membrane protein DedA with SNARE-associated domain